MQVLNSCLRKCSYPLIPLVLFSLLVVPGCERKEKAKPAAIKPEAVKHREINLRETRLAAIPEDYAQWGNISFSEDGQQVLYTARKKDKHFIVVATTAGEHRGKAYDSGSFLIKSPDGRRFAFGGKKGKKKYLVVDNKELRGLSDAEVAPDAFSPDGSLIACEVGGPKDKNWFVLVTDGMHEVYRSPVYPDTYRRASFSPDGRLLVYELGDDKRSTAIKKKRTLFFFDVVARKIIKERVCEDCVSAGKISFSSDSSRAIYGVRKEGRNFLVLIDFAQDEERQVELPYEAPGQFVLGPDGEKIVYIANKEGRHLLVVSPWESPAKGKESGPYDGIVRATFGPGSSTVLYHAMRKGKWRSVVGTEEGPKYDSVGDATVFSPDGANMAYAANSGGERGKQGFSGGKWFMVVADTEEPDEAREGPGYDMVVSPVFSPDGRYIAYRARKGPMNNARRFIVIADAETGGVIKEGPAGDEIWPPVWNADSRVVGYGARTDRELWWKVETLP